MLNVGDKVTLKKIDKRRKNPDLRVWRIVAVNYNEYRKENMYNLVEVEYGLDERYDFIESVLLKQYKKVEE